MKNEFISSVFSRAAHASTSIRGWVETLRTPDDPADENYRKGLEIINNEMAVSTIWWKSCWISACPQNGRIRMDRARWTFVAELTGCGAVL